MCSILQYIFRDGNRMYIIQGDLEEEGITFEDASQYITDDSNLQVQDSSNNCYAKRSS